MQHHLHVVLEASGWKSTQPPACLHLLVQRPGSITDPTKASIPARLAFEAVWIYNFTTGEILKNKSGQAVVPVIDAVEVGTEWLRDNRFVISSLPVEQNLNFA